MSAATTSRRDMRLTLAAMTLSSSMILVDQTAVPLAAPHAILDLHASVSDAQWLLTANILPLAALMVFGGRLGDLFGMRRVFLFGAVDVAAFQATVAVSAGIALLGARFSLILVRKTDRVKTGGVFARRSRWVAVGQGRSPAITRRPPESIDQAQS